jgi:hypothetical protein
VLSVAAASPIVEVAKAGVAAIGTNALAMSSEAITQRVRVVRSFTETVLPGGFSRVLLFVGDP